MGRQREPALEQLALEQLALEQLALEQLALEQLAHEQLAHEQLTYGQLERGRPVRRVGQAEQRVSLLVGVGFLGPWPRSATRAQISPQYK
jgi:hypothetical protein